jgi:hypothetical protein
MQSICGSSRAPQQGPASPRVHEKLIHEIMSPRPQWDEMGCGIKNSLGQNIVAKAAMGYAFSAIARLAIPQIA